MTGPSRGQEPPPTADNSPQELIRSLRIVWFGLLMGQVLYGFVIMVIGGSLWKGPGPSDLETPLSIVLGALVVAAGVGLSVFRRAFIAELRSRAEALRQEADPLVAVSAPYRGFFIRTHGLVEGTGLFGLVSYLVTGMTLALVVIAASIAWFLLNFPTEDRARRLVQGAIESA
jgi:hypothetical protein